MELIRKIQACKFAMVFFSSFVVSAGGFLGSFEPPKVYTLAICANLGNVIPVSFVPVHALVPRLIVSCLRNIVVVLRISTLSKVLAAIVKTIAVLVVNLYAFRCTQNKSVHQGRYVVDPGIPCSRTGFVSVPMELGNPFIVNVINKGNFAMGERNLFHAYSKEKALCIAG